MAIEAGMDNRKMLTLIMVKYTMDQRRLLGSKLNGTLMAELKVKSCRYLKLKIKMVEVNNSCQSSQ